MPLLSERIRQIRIDNKLTQEAFAKALGVHRAHISKVETGAANPSGQLILAICFEFQISLDWLLEGSVPMKIELKSDSGKALRLFEQLYGFEMLSKLLNLGYIGVEEMGKYKKIIDFLGPDIIRLEKLPVKPGDPEVIEIVQDILKRLQSTASSKSKDANQQDDVLFFEALTQTEQSIVRLLREIDSNSFKDLCLFLAVKADRLEPDQRKKLKPDIAALRDATK